MLLRSEPYFDYFIYGTWIMSIIHIKIFYFNCYIYHELSRWDFFLLL